MNDQAARAVRGGRRRAGSGNKTPQHVPRWAVGMTELTARTVLVFVRNLKRCLRVRGDDPRLGVTKPDSRG